MTPGALSALVSDPDMQAQYFAHPAHRGHQMWLPSPIPHEIDFGFLHNTKTLRLIDPFDGRRPWRIDAAHPDGDHAVYPIAYFLMLDCDSAECIAMFLTGTLGRDDPRFDDCRRLVDWLSITQMNIQPYPAFIEQFAKSCDPAAARRNVARLNRALLELGSMDGLYYQATGVRRLSEQARSTLRDRFSTD